MPAQLPHLDGAAGAAFQLRYPAEETVDIEHVEGTVAVRAGSPSVTVKLRAAVSETNLRDVAWRIVQEALDIRAATHRMAMSTYRGDHEYALWTLGSSGYTLVVVDVVHSRWNMTASMTVSGSASSPSPPPPPPVPHHPALRFYRLAQLSDDLFDAYRNAYLALECIVSDVSSKLQSESEVNWLTRVLQGPLAPAVPGGIVVADAVDKIYKFGRLPLFHAKTGNLFYAPQGDERAEIQASLATLHMLLASIMKTRISPLIAGGWGRMSQSVVDNMGRVTFHANEIVYGLGLQTETMRVSMEIVEVPRRFGNLWARVTTPAPTTVAALETIAFREDGNETISLSLRELIPLRKVSSVRIELNQLESNVRAPNPLHCA